MGPNGCGCPGNSGVNGSRTYFEPVDFQSGGLGEQPRPSGGPFLLSSATLDLSALKSPPGMSAGAIVLNSEALIQNALSGIAEPWRS